jgi:hypothetical protein
MQRALPTSTRLMERPTSLQSRMPCATCIAVLVRLSFAAMASPALAQDPLPIPGNLGATYSMPIEPARIHLHSPPHPPNRRRCTRWYIAQSGPGLYLQVPFPDECPGGGSGIAAKGLGPSPRPLVVVPRRAGAR